MCRITSSAVIRSAHFWPMSNRLASCGPMARSPTPFVTIIVAHRVDRRRANTARRRATSDHQRVNAFIDEVNDHKRRLLAEARGFAEVLLLVHIKVGHGSLRSLHGWRDSPASQPEYSSRTLPLPSHAQYCANCVATTSSYFGWPLIRPTFLWNSVIPSTNSRDTVAS